MIEYGIAAGGTSGGGGYGSGGFGQFMDTVTANPTALMIGGGIVLLVLYFLLRR